MAPESFEEIVDAANRLPKTQRRALMRELNVEERSEDAVKAFFALRGMGKGIWGSAEEIDRYIQKERDAWDR